MNLGHIDKVEENAKSYVLILKEASRTQLATEALSKFAIKSSSELSDDAKKELKTRLLDAVNSSNHLGKLARDLADHIEKGVASTETIDLLNHDNISAKKAKAIQDALKKHKEVYKALNQTLINYGFNFASYLQQQPQQNQQQQQGQQQKTAEETLAAGNIHRNAATLAAQSKQRGGSAVVGERSASTSSSPQKTPSTQKVASKNEGRNVTMARQAREETLTPGLNAQKP